MQQNEIDLTVIAEKAMQELGFYTELSDSLLKELATITQPAKLEVTPDVRDLRHLLWVSIDNDDSRDLDQLTYAEQNSGKDKMYVAIADVDALVKKNSQIDKFAAHNTTSVYTPTKVFPMLPLKLSTDLTSLNEKTDRRAIVVEMDVNDKGEYVATGIYSAWVRNYAKLTYTNVANWIERKVPLPNLNENQDAIQQNLTLQDQISQRIKKNRYRQGALSFGTIEVHPVIMNGMAIELKLSEHTRAHMLIENCMIATNVLVTHYLTENGLPTLRRIVKVPKRWDRIVDLAKEYQWKLPDEPNSKALQEFLLEQRRVDPLRFPDLSLSVIKLVGKGEYIAQLPGAPDSGHFDLALYEYAHTTAPNRRYPDVIMQRLLKSLLYKQNAPYNLAELTTLGEHCTQKEDDATKVERRMVKSAAAMVLEPQVGSVFSALVTGSGQNGTWVRIVDPPVEGKLIEGYLDVDVGDHITVKLADVDIARGYIDFVKQ